MNLQDVLEQLSTATRSLKLSAAWLESQTDDQIREIGSGDWLPLTSAVHNLEERVIQVDRVFNRGEEARLDLGRDLIELEPATLRESPQKIGGTPGGGRTGLGGSCSRPFSGERDGGRERLDLVTDSDSLTRCRA